MISNTNYLLGDDSIFLINMANNFNAGKILIEQAMKEVVKAIL